MATVGWFEEGSDNVFADLGLPDPDERLVKADLAMRIVERACAQGCTSEQVECLLGVDVQQASQLLSGRLSAFSTDRLRLVLARLERDLEIVQTASGRVGMGRA